MKTFEQIKSDFRVCQIDNIFYIQKKQRFGWSYNTNEQVTDFLVTTAIFGCLGLLLFIVCSIIALFQWSPNNGMLISFCLFSISFIAHFIYLNFSKKLALTAYTLSQAEDIIDDRVDTILRLMTNDELKKSEKEFKNKNKVKKYHYFYTEKQLRKEKLKKLKNSSIKII